MDDGVNSLDTSWNTVLKKINDTFSNCGTNINESKHAAVVQ